MRSHLRSFLLVFVIALAVRLGAAVWLGVDGPPRGDERGYMLLAQSLAAGEGLHLPVPADVVSAAGLDSVQPLRAFRGPVVPLFLAPVAALGGGLAAMRVLLLLAGALCAPLLLHAARPLLGDRAALWAALGYAVWPPHVFVSAHALSEPLSMALLLPAVALAARARVDGSGRATLAAGLLGGLAVLARPAALLPVVLLGAVVGDRRRAAFLALGMVAVLAPWIVRNHVLLGRPMITTNSGVTLVGANSPAAASAQPPGKWLAPGAVYEGRADAPDLGMWGWSGVGEEASDRRFTAHAASWARAEPVAAARLVLWKLVRLFDPDPRSNKPDASRKALLGWLSLTPVLLLALVGAAALRTGPPGWGPWLALLAGTVLTAALFYGDARMRAAADPTLLLLAAAGLLHLLPARASPS
jgi:hypothetical protein